ncbi:hypothetical protein DsansV1_C29g0211761 [Dioscorea sansibarensis]
MFAADDRETEDPMLIVKDIEPLGAEARREARDHADFSKTSNTDLAAAGDRAAADKVLVDLGPIKATNHSPDLLRRRFHSLRQQRRAPPRPRAILVVRFDRGLQLLVLLHREPRRNLIHPRSRASKIHTNKNSNLWRGLFHIPFADIEEKDCFKKRGR